jgi:hypothetical protein
VYVGALTPPFAAATPPVCTVWEEPLTSGGLDDPGLCVNPDGVGLRGGVFWQPHKTIQAVKSKLAPSMDLNAIAGLLGSLRLVARLLLSSSRKREVSWGREQVIRPLTIEAGEP